MKRSEPKRFVTSHYYLLGTSLLLSERRSYDSDSSSINRNEVSLKALRNYKKLIFLRDVTDG